MKLTIKIFAGLALAALTGLPALAAEGPLPAKNIGYSFEGPFGVFDRGQLQRGYQVYKEVCSNCHSMRFVKFRNLSEPGGPDFTPEEVKAIAAGFQITDGPNDQGEMYQRPGLPSDTFPAPFPNAQAAKAALGADPPDLSLITKARAGWEGKLSSLYLTKMFFGQGGPQYVYSILTGFQDAPAGEKGPPGKYYNPYFQAGPWISMPPPLSDGQVTYGDGTKATVDQMSRDVSAFLAWTAEPTMEARKRTGFEVLVYMAVLTVLLYLVKKAIWSDVEH